ncbi:MAG: hypothetical protein ACYTAF_02965, partial [Planctomycetota bacterium]
MVPPPQPPHRPGRPRTGGKIPSTRRAGGPRVPTRRRAPEEEQDDLFVGEVEEVSRGFFRDKRMILMIAGGAVAGLLLF